MAAKALVLDANILLRAVLGRRVREIIEAHAGTVSFLVPEAAFAEAEEHLQTLVVRRGGNPERARAAFVRLSALLELVVCEACAEFEADARERLGSRDPDDCPVLALALALACPIWTEDPDFFGCGVATWTSNRVLMFLRD